MAARPTVTFDLWHTLVHLEPRAEGEYLEQIYAAATRVLRASPRRAGAPERTDAELRAAFDEEMRRAVDRSHEGVTVTPAEQMVRAAAIAGREPNPEAYVEELRRLVAATDFRVAPGALETLGRLRSEGYHVGIVSNTVGEPGRFLRESLRRRGFDRSIEVYVFSDEEPWTKPAPEIFHAALDRLGGTPSAAVHVGDGWADLEGARRAHLRSGILFTGLRDYAPEYRDLNYAPSLEGVPVPHRVARLDEVPGLLARVLPPVPP